MSKDLYIDYIEKSLSLAENYTSNLHPDILKIEGMCVSKVRHFLNNLVSYFPCKNYLEIGSFCGATIISAGYNNSANLFAIDDFSIGKNLSEEDKIKLSKRIPNFIWDVKKEFIKNTTQWLSNMTFIEKDSFSVNIKEFKEKYGTVPVYFYDGDHTTEGTYKGFTYFNDILENEFIAIVDDWRWKRVRNGTFKAFEKLKYNVVKQWELSARYFGDEKQWGNGVYVAVLEK